MNHSILPGRCIPLLSACLCALCGLLAVSGCIAYKAPVISLVRGPEANYLQEGSGLNSRSTNANQQSAKNTAPQLQLENQATAEMASNMEATRTVGLKQGVAQDKAIAQGRDQTSAGQQSTDKSTTGQTGNDTLGVPESTVGTAVKAAAAGATGDAGLTTEKAAAAASLLKQATDVQSYTCPTCQGNGVGADGKACPTCGGKGSISAADSALLKAAPIEPAVPAATTTK
jgi:hypothetical protein